MAKSSDIVTYLFFLFFIFINCIFLYGGTIYLCIFPRLRISQAAPQSLFFLFCVPST